MSPTSTNVAQLIDRNVSGSSSVKGKGGGHQSVVTVTKHSEFKLFIASPDDERLSASVYLRDRGTVLL